MNKVITIDGPVASGKSTIARLLAHELSIGYLSSGFFYRGIAYALLRDGLSWDITDEALKPYLRTERFVYKWESDGKSNLFLDGVQITAFLKSPTIDVYSSHLAQHKGVRDFVLLLQRDLAHHYSLVAEGRDLGSVVFPEATFKFFLTADLVTRAQRWMALQANLGTSMTLDDALRLVDQRDQRDFSRTIAPLIVPLGAYIIDGSHKSTTEIVFEMLAIIHNGPADHCLG